jgi:branched-chain amino acid transport system permease protein
MFGSRVAHSFNGNRIVRVAAVIISVAVALVPLGYDEVAIYRAGLVLIFFVAALGLHLLVNWSGQLSLAHAGMVGLPAFSVLTVSNRTNVSPIYFLPLGMAVGALTGAVVALPTLRARGLQVAIVTLVAGIAIDSFFFSKPWLVGSASGLAAAPTRLGTIDFPTSRRLYPVLLVIVAVAVLGTWVLMHSKVARAWFWVRENTEAAAAFGVPVGLYKILAFAAAGCLAGLSGSLSVCWIGQLTGTAFPTDLSFSYLVVVVLAGAGFAGGVASAALLLEGGRLYLMGVAGWIEAAIAYGGPIGLVFNLTVTPGGFNAVGRDLTHSIVRFGVRERPQAKPPYLPAGLSDGDHVRALSPCVPPAGADHPTPLRPLLEVDRISVRFGGLRALASTSLHVHTGTVVGLIGPNGAGKTTLFNVVSGLIQADTGTVRFGGEDVTTMSASRRAARGIGRSFQHLGLMQDQTVRVNLMAAQFLSVDYGIMEPLLRPWKWRAEERRLNRETCDVADALHLSDVLDSRVRDLSFGRARFVEMACVLVGRPKLMMLDEPTTGLDLWEVEQLLEILRRRQEEGSTILVVAHDVRFIMDLSDYVYVLASGSILAEGRAREIQSNPEVVQAYLGSTA